MNPENIHLIRLKKWITDGVKEINISGLSGSARTYFLSQLLMETEKPCLIILPKARDAEILFRELYFFLPQIYTDSGPGQRRLYDFPTYDISPLSGLSPHRDVINHRLEALYALTAEKDPIVITSIDAVLFKILPKTEMTKVLEFLEVGEEVDREDLIKKLETTGYLRTSLVEETGDYSVRGGVMDIFPPLYDKPVRFEFWGEQLESIRHFDPMSQRSTTDLREMILLPANEIIMSPKNMKQARSMGRLPEQGSEGFSFPGQEAWLNHFYSRLDSLIDFFPHHGFITFFDPGRIEAEMEKNAERFYDSINRYQQEAGERGSPFPETDGILIPEEERGTVFGPYQRLSFCELPLWEEGGNARSIEIKDVSEIDGELDLRVTGKGRISMAPLAEKISAWNDLGSETVLVCRTEQQAGRLKEILNNYDVEVDEVVDHWSKVSARKSISICLGRLSKGFIWQEIGICIVSEDEIFGPKQSKTRTKDKRIEGALDWTSFSQLKVGDLVVHQDHGIGRYGGLLKMEIEERINDFVIVEYADNDRLYTPADRISILQKYVGADEKEPKLDRLGGKSWNLAKSKAKKSIMEVARQLVDIYALRKYRKGFAFSRPDNYFREFEATFEYEETPDQIKAIEDVLSDMESDRPMDRLICGDVGFGKTEVAIRAAFKVVSDGKQVAILVPTTVLAEQHYETFGKRMIPYHVKVGVLSRFKSRLEQQEIIANVRSGKIDILVGTHRLLQKDISFKDLGLIIIDEEQRFGVKQKERLKKFRTLVDVLALTATPIPRTLHMSLMGVRDLSIIETPPEERQAISTYLSHYDGSTIKRAIEFEMERGGQVFFVHNRVKTIDLVAHKLINLVPGARFEIAHGQMKEKELEDAMIRFLKKDIDVLVCTTIIESGLDIPSANTIIINEVDRLGMAQIYQLRGRVGRSTESAYAYLLLSKDSIMTRPAEKRLKALMDHSQLGAGIHLAMHDLKIRGGGNILGFSQSGHIASIGYELYMNMIEQAVAELKGEEWHEEINPEIDIDIPAHLPEEYISDIDVRLNLYRRLSNLREESDLSSVQEEINDRFGALPEAVSNLVKIMELRLGLKRIGVIRLDIKTDYLLFSFSEGTTVKPERVVELEEIRRSRIQFLSGSKLKVRIFKNSVLDALDSAQSMIKVLEKTCS